MGSEVRRVVGCLGLACSLMACTPEDPVEAPTTAGEGADEVGTSEDTGTETDATETDETETTETDTGAQECACAPGTDLIYVVSKFGDIWTYDPPTDTFAEVGTITCGSGLVYSMAVDHDGRGWVLDLDTRDLFTVDLAAPQNCAEPPWVPGNGGFNYFGMGFVSHDTLEVCEKLYLHSYSGSGPFSEGEDLGSLAVYDPADGSLETLASIDFDGGEIDGTGDGRLFAFAGENPVKLVEYDRESGEALTVLPLDGLDKTSASAFAFHSGDIYLFTEAEAQGCADCLEGCSEEYAACLEDPECAEALDCALSQGEVTDECGGLIYASVQDCMAGTCHDACFPIGGKLSQVHRLDWDESEGNGKALSLVHPLAPLRIVGAGTSICAPLQVP